MCPWLRLFSEWLAVKVVVHASDGMLLIYSVVVFIFGQRNVVSNFVVVNGNQNNPIAKLKYGFQWLNADASIAIDLNIYDPDTARFLELLYFT